LVAPPRTDTAADVEQQRVQPEGKTYTYQGHECYYQELPPQPQGRPETTAMVMVHGFGINSCHFEKNVEALAKAGVHVYCPDLLGFGQSEKPVNVTYCSELWAGQVEHFIDTVVRRPCVVVGNSIGGYVGMQVAADRPDVVSGLALLNSAGRWGVLNPLGVEVPLLRWRPLANWLGRLLFNNARQPEQIRQTLEQVYVDKSAVTDTLVQSILEPAQGDAADEAGPVLFGSLFVAPKGRSWPQLLGGPDNYKGPLLLLWGQRDPWIVPFYADMLLQMRPDSTLHWINAGHCPHHERPDKVNNLLIEWIQNEVTHERDDRHQQHTWGEAVLAAKDTDSHSGQTRIAFVKPIDGEGEEKEVEGEGEMGRREVASKIKSNRRPVVRRTEWEWEM